MKLEKEEQMFRKRILELATTAYHKEICMYTDFLNLNEISIFHNMINELPPIGFSIYGGYEQAERVMVCFYGNLTDCHGDLTGTELITLKDFPIQCLSIKPTNEKFAQELDHRDFLGSIMNLSIQRNKIGDIQVQKKSAILFCNSKIAEYLIGNLERIRHTNVKVTVADTQITTLNLQYKEVSQSVPSFRLDVMIAVAFHISRSSVTSLIEGEKVFVNAKLTVSNSYILKEGDIVSVRGHGKFKFQSQGNMTKKGRIYANLLIYI